MFVNTKKTRKPILESASTEKAFFAIFFANISKTMRDFLRIPKGNLKF